jgi:hypothetical protein
MEYKKEECQSVVRQETKRVRDGVTDLLLPLPSHPFSFEHSAPFTSDWFPPVPSSHEVHSQSWLPSAPEYHRLHIQEAFNLDPKTSGTDRTTFPIVLRASRVSNGHLIDREWVRGLDATGSGYSPTAGCSESDNYFLKFQKLMKFYWSVKELPASQKRAI